MAPPRSQPSGAGDVARTDAIRGRAAANPMPRTPQPPPIDGILVVDKPRGKTSHDVVESVRRMAGFRQIGHLGTLDPLATGVLVLALGRATRLARFYSGRRKRYMCAARFGFATDTYDADGEPLTADSAPSLDAAELQELASRFVGRIQQTPPAFSAKKIHGRPAHELARKHKPVELAPVEVDVYEFRLTGVEGTVARFTVECGAGTYIRALAHDLGKLHGSGAHLAEISRTAVGEFTIDQAVSLAELTEDAEAGKLASRVIPLENLLPDLPRAAVLPVIEKRIRHGAKFNLPLAQIQPGRTTAAQSAPAQLDSGDWKPARLRIFNQQGRLIAIAEPVVPRTYQPVLVFDSAQ
jgi:tRNA pseudouridine55 synthase